MDFMEELAGPGAGEGCSRRDDPRGAGEPRSLPPTSALPGASEEARVTIDPDTGQIIVYGQDLDEDGNVVREWETHRTISGGSPPRLPSR